MNLIQENIARLEAQASELESQLRKVRAAIQALRTGHSPERTRSAKDALQELLQKQNGVARRQIPEKLAGLGAPCTPNTVQFVISSNKDLFKRHGGKVYLRGTEPKA